MHDVLLHFIHECQFPQFRDCLRYCCQWQEWLAGDHRAVDFGNHLQQHLVLLLVRTDRVGHSLNCLQIAALAESVPEQTLVALQGQQIRADYERVCDSGLAELSQKAREFVSLRNRDVLKLGNESQNLD